MPFTLLDFIKALVIVGGVNLIAIGTVQDSFAATFIGGMLLTAGVLPFRSR